MRRAVAVACLTLLLVPGALAKAPKQGTIEPGVGMAGVRLGQFAKVLNRGPDRQFVRGHSTRSFGRVYQFCFEGDQCAWRVRGGGFFSITINTLKDRVIAMQTDARGWRTPEGIGRGSKASEVRAAYPAARLRTRCVAPAGAEVRGYLLREPGQGHALRAAPDGGRRSHPRGGSRLPLSLTAVMNR